jgi:hypothetical protein
MSMLLGATNSSNSSYSLEFSSKPEAENLVSTTVAALEQSGFHKVGNDANLELQFRNLPIWAYVSSPKNGVLRLSFIQLRGGCGHNPEVSGVNEIIAYVRASLESSFGPASIEEIHLANKSPQPNTAYMDSPRSQEN